MDFISVHEKLPPPNSEIFVIRRIEVHGYMVNKVGTKYVGGRPAEVLLDSVTHWYPVKLPDGLPQIEKVIDT